MQNTRHVLAVHLATGGVGTCASHRVRALEGMQTSSLESQDEGKTDRNRKTDKEEIAARTTPCQRKIIVRAVEMNAPRVEQQSRGTHGRESGANTTAGSKPEPTASLSAHVWRVNGVPAQRPFQPFASSQPAFSLHALRTSAVAISTLVLGRSVSFSRQAWAAPRIASHSTRPVRRAPPTADIQ